MKTRIIFGAVALCGVLVAGLAARQVGWIDGGLGIRFTAGPWLLSGSDDPASDARATAAPYGSLYCRSNTTSSACYVKTSDVSGTTWTEVGAGSGTVTHTGTLTANLPIIGNGSADITTGTRSGNTTEFATISGALTSGNCIKSDASGNLVDAAATCGGGGGGTGSSRTSELLTNPGFETGDLTGWTTEAGFSSGSAQTVNGSVNPHSGTYMLGASATVETRLSQTIDVSAYATDIDAGAAIMVAQVFTSKEFNDGDGTRILLVFLDGSSNQVGYFNMPVYANGAALGTWFGMNYSVVVPENTRSIKYMLSILRNAGTNNDSQADDASLKLIHGI